MTIKNIIKSEIKRQAETINLIASENYAPKEVLEVLGSPLVNKYSEGYPGRRYYPGNKYYDELELLAQKNIKKLFQLGDEWQVNVQPYSGSPANMAVFYALLQTGESFLGMQLAAGGHLTHGHRVNFSGKFYRALQYGVDLDSGYLDYDDLERLIKENHPRLVVSGATAYPRQIDFARIGKATRKAGAYHLADISHIAGLVAADLHPSPFEWADVVTMTTHKTLRGPRGAVIVFRNDLADRINRAVFPGLQGGPHNNQTAAIALMAELDSRPAFKSYQKQIIKNAQVLAEELKAKDLKLATGGTDNHLMLVDLRSNNLDGLRAEKMLEDVGIIANRNSLPTDESPFKPFGLRLGTAAATTRGMKEAEMKKIAGWISDVLLEGGGVKIKEAVKRLCKKYPIYND